MDGGAVGEASIVIWTLITKGVGPGQRTQTDSLLTECAEDMGRRRRKQGNRGLSASGEGAAGRRDPPSPVLQVPVYG